MELSQAAQIITFAVFGLLAVLGALGMATTMSMFRSAIFLMASFVGVAGIFILLAADLVGMLQVMMYVGGMLVMALFMVLFSSDPGGEMMSSMMKLRGFERLFSIGLSRPQDHSSDDDGGGGHHDMSMFTPIKKPAAIVAGLTLGLLVALILLRQEAWARFAAIPDPDSSRRIGHLLMGKYMVAFEGAGLLILLGIFGAVWVARAGRRVGLPDRVGMPDREKLRAAVDEPPRDVDGGNAEDS